MIMRRSAPGIRFPAGIVRRHRPRPPPPQCRVNWFGQGSRSWKASPCTAHPSHRLYNFESPSMLSSIPTMKPPRRLFGPKPRSIKNASAHVSPTNDSGYQRSARLGLGLQCQPRRSIGFMPAATDLAHSLTIAWASTCAVVVLHALGADRRSEEIQTDPRAPPQILG